MQLLSDTTPLPGEHPGNFLELPSEVIKLKEAGLVDCPWTARRFKTPLSVRSSSRALSCAASRDDSGEAWQDHLGGDVLMHQNRKRKSTSNSKLMVHSMQMEFDCSFAQIKLACDCFVRKAFCREKHDLPFASAQNSICR
jgi:hypothetical protein